MKMKWWIRDIKAREIVIPFTDLISRMVNLVSINSKDHFGDKQMVLFIVVLSLSFFAQFAVTQLALSRVYSDKAKATTTPTYYICQCGGGINKALQSRGKMA